MYIVSRCLLGVNCKYNGGNNRNDEVIRFCETHSCFDVCPETAGGLKSPRVPSELTESNDAKGAEPADGGAVAMRGKYFKVIDSEGTDVTANFVSGAARSYWDAIPEAERRGEPVEGAILKANSPSCGCGEVYDGTFTGRLTEGDGVFTALLKNNDITVATEKNFKEVFRDAIK